MLWLNRLAHSCQEHPESAEEMGKVLPPDGTGGIWHQDLWEVLRGDGPVCNYFWILVMGNNAPHSAGIGGGWIIEYRCRFMAWYLDVRTENGSTPPLAGRWWEQGWVQLGSILPSVTTLCPSTLLCGHFLHSDGRGEASSIPGWHVLVVTGGRTIHGWGDGGGIVGYVTGVNA